MAKHNFEAPRIGKVGDLQPFRRVDTRECRKCGAVAGRCHHLTADEDIVWLSRTQDRRHNHAAWEPSEQARAKLLHAHGYSNRQIAEAMNKTEGAVAGALWRMGVRR